MNRLLRFCFSGLLLSFGLNTAAQAQAGVLMNAARIGTSVAIGMAVPDNLHPMTLANTQYACKGMGSYQLRSAPWQSAYLELTNTELRAGKYKDIQQFSLEDLQQVVVRADTFVVVHNVKFPDSEATFDEAVLGRRSWRRPQVELFEYSAAAGTLPMLHFPDGKAVVLPKKPKDFRAAMLLLVGDHAQLAEQLRGTSFSPADAPQILDMYLRWKPAGFNTAALWAAPPVEVK